MAGFNLALVGFASFILVFLKAFQQQNVIGGFYWYITPVSIGMAFCEITIILFVTASRDWNMGLPIGIGAGLGAMLGMFIHRKYIRKRKEV